jgi:hypothetical protein
MPEEQASSPESVQAPEDFNAYIAWRKGAQAEPPAAEEETTPQDDGLEAAAEADGEDLESKTPPPAPDPEDKQEPPVSAGVQKRIDRVVAKQREAERKAQEFERRAAELERKLAAFQEPRPAQETAPAAASQSSPAEGEPQVENFATYEEYTRAQIRYELQQEKKAAEAADQQRKARESLDSSLKEWRERVEEAKKNPAYADFDEVLEGANIPISDVMRDALLGETAGPQCAYYLATHPDEARRIAALPLARSAAEIGKLAGKLAAPEPQKPRTSSAPKPPTPVTPKSTAPAKSIYDEDIEFNAYERRRNAQLKRK